MRDTTFFINPKAILFNDELDAKNGHETIACNWPDETYLKINSAAYRVLRVIDEQPGLSLSQIAFATRRPETSIQRFLGQMIKENIVLAK